MVIAVAQCYKLSMFSFAIRICESGCRLHSPIFATNPRKQHMPVCSTLDLFQPLPSDLHIRHIISISTLVIDVSVKVLKVYNIRC